MSFFSTLMSLFRQHANDVLPPGRRVYAIGDIHGFAGHLEALLDVIARDVALSPAARAEIVFLGDYIDRGPDSASVLGRLARREVPLPFVALRGNHEAMMLEALVEPDGMAHWLRSGGDATLLSYGIPTDGARGRKALAHVRQSLIEDMPALDRAFLSTTALSHVIGPYTFVHAGLKPGVALDQQSTDDLLWIRDDFYDAAETFDGVIVHGHTPRRRPENLAHRINVDTGVFKYGALTCAVLEGSDRRFLSTRG